MKTGSYNNSTGWGKGVGGGWGAGSFGGGGVQQPVGRDSCGILTATKLGASQKKKRQQLPPVRGQAFADPPVFLCCCESSL